MCAVQWEDPGDVPFEDDSGFRYTLSADGKRLTGDTSMSQYLWVEQYSAELGRPYFFNQVNRHWTSQCRTTVPIWVRRSVACEKRLKQPWLLATEWM